MIARRQAFDYPWMHCKCAITPLYEECFKSWYIWLSLYMRNDHQMTVDQRRVELEDWLQQHFQRQSIQVQPLAGDASFRRYFRVAVNGDHFVAMDAPPNKESSMPFVAIAHSLSDLGLCVPQIIDADVAAGRLLLSDFGDRLYFNELNTDNVDQLYHQAFDSLMLMQTCKAIQGYEVPRFDAQTYLSEMNLFRDWYLAQQMAVTITDSEQQMLDHVFQLLIDEALQQPQVFVHRDYHSRNLMVLNDNRLGIIDFQDAVWGPITYDLLSLLRDCYIDWPVERVRHWVNEFHQMLLRAGRIDMDDAQQFMRWFDWIGLQRNLKCIGIFSRLNIRDNKPGFLHDIPRVVGYAQYVCAKYPEFSDLAKLLKRYAN